MPSPLNSDLFMNLDGPAAARRELRSYGFLTGKEASARPNAVGSCPASLERLTLYVRPGSWPSLPIFAVVMKDASGWGWTMTDENVESLRTRIRAQRRLGADRAAREF